MRNIGKFAKPGKGALGCFSRQMGATAVSVQGLSGGVLVAMYTGWRGIIWGEEYAEGWRL